MVRWWFGVITSWIKLLLLIHSTSHYNTTRLKALPRVLPIGCGGKCGTIRIHSDNGNLNEGTRVGLLGDVSENGK